MIRQGRISPAQRRAHENLFQHYASKEGDKIPFAQLFNDPHPQIVEIGFGMGTTLIEYAKLYPEHNFIGIEVHPPGIGALLNLIDTHQLKNIRIIEGDAVLALKEQCPDGSLAGINIFFPDPWPKKRHHKRRLIQPEFLNLLAQKLQTGGILHLATDWENYAEQMSELLAQNAQFEKINQQRGDRPLTKFEQKGLDKGHKVFDFQYRKIS